MARLDALPSGPGPAVEAGLAQRLRVLETCFRQVAATRMRGVPVLNPSLQVQAVGFRVQASPPQPGGWAQSENVPPAWASGVLVTPWFMNLLRLPLRPLTAVAAVEAGWLAPGAVASRRLGAQPLDFIGALEGEGQPGELGAFEVCSLFSPMFQFADQEAAVATAFEVLKLLHQSPVAGVLQPQASATRPAEAAGHPARAPAVAPVASPQADLARAPALTNAPAQMPAQMPAQVPAQVPSRRGFLLGRRTHPGSP